MKSFPECEEYKSDSKIVLKEKKSQFTLINSYKLMILIIRVDDCVIKEGLRCDYMIFPDSEKKDIEIYLELKGRDIPHGVKQLESTLIKLSENYHKKKKKCFLISTCCPTSSSEIFNYKKKFKKNYNAELIIKNTPYNYKIN